MDKLIKHRRRHLCNSLTHFFRPALHFPCLLNHLEFPTLEIVYLLPLILLLTLFPCLPFLLSILLSNTPFQLPCLKHFLLYTHAIFKRASGVHFLLLLIEGVKSL